MVGHYAEWEHGRSDRKRRHGNGAAHPREGKDDGRLAVHRPVLLMMLGLGAAQPVSDGVVERKVDGEADGDRDGHGLEDVELPAEEDEDGHRDEDDAAEATTEMKRK